MRFPQYGQRPCFRSFSLNVVPQNWQVRGSGLYMAVCFNGGCLAAWDDDLCKLMSRFTGLFSSCMESYKSERVMSSLNSNACLKQMFACIFDVYVESVN
jgi:hypothetical protein